MTRLKLLTALRYYAIVSLLFVVTFTSLRICEYSLIRDRIGHALAYEWTGFFYDWIFASSTVMVVLFFYLIVSFINLRAAITLATAIFALVIIGSFCLIQYFSVPLTPLSVDVFGYSLNDILTTISSSGGIKVSTILPFLLYLCAFPGAVVWICRRSLPERLPLAAIAIVLVLITSMASFGNKPTAEEFPDVHVYNVVVSKPSYFVDRTLKHFFTEEIGKEPIEPYPFLHDVEYKDILSQFLTPASDYPDVVLVIVEGLGADFVNNGAYSGFTPFLDSLSGESLYWKNTLSNAGRTFGALPSILGSLPYGEQGFMEYAADMPDHQTLISLLKPFGYQTNFFYGGNASFDNQGAFLEYQGIDYLLDDAKFPPSMEKMEANEGSFTWGYADRDVFDYSFVRLNEEKNSPRLNVYLTLSTHEPFIVPEEKFLEGFDKVIEQSSWTEEKKEKYSAYKNILSCLLYTDDAIRGFFKRYKERPEFKNTIFIITGDHRLVPVPHDSQLSRFQVPLMIYSPALRKPQEFQSLALHSDITPTLLGYLQSGYGMEFPTQMPFISDLLPSEEAFASSVDIALMRNKNETIDFIEGEWFLSDGRLFKIQPDLSIASSDDMEVKNRLEKKLRDFNSRSIFACNNNSVSNIKNKPLEHHFRFTEQDQAFLREQNIAEYKPDELFQKARDLAFAEEFLKSRILFRYILNGNPDHHDARLLLARTYGWAGDYDSARVFLAQTIKRAPRYADAYVALSDVEYWANNLGDALAMADAGLKIDPDNADLRVRRARSLWLTRQKAQGRQEIEKVLAEHPNHQLAIDILQEMNNENI